MNLKNLIKTCADKLNNAGIEASTFEAGAVVCHSLKVSRAYTFAHPEREISEAELTLVMKNIDKRCQRVPLQQIIGEQEFMSMNFKVDENVLIPRQDTEILVETVLELRGEVREPQYILDIGTGSGCIAVSLAVNLGNSRVTAVDISEAALGVAQKNAFSNGVADRLTFIKSNLFSALPQDSEFDIVVSNPPYIPTADIDGLEPEVKCFEPMLALDGGIDGLDFYRRISEGAKKHLRAKGLIAFEVGIYQADAVSLILKEDSYCNIKVIKDLSGIDRVVCAEFIPSIFS